MEYILGSTAIIIGVFTLVYLKNKNKIYKSQFTVNISTRPSFKGLKNINVDISLFNKSKKDNFEIQKAIQLFAANKLKNIYIKNKDLKKSEIEFKKELVKFSEKVPFRLMTLNLTK